MIQQKGKSQSGDRNCPGRKRRIGIGFGGGPYTVQQMTEAVRLAEQSGFESAWMTNDIGGRTPFVTLACWAMVTERVRLGVAVTNPCARHPVEIAQTMATLDEASNGRVVLGIGTGASWRSLISGRWDKPIGLMKETIQVIRGLWAEPETTYRGVPVSIRDSDWVWPNAPPASFREDIPIYMGAGGPQMTRLAARRADGLLIAMGKFVPNIAAQVEMFRATAKGAGRDPGELEIAPLIMTYVAESEGELDVMRRIIAFETHRLTEDVALRQEFEPEAFRQIKEIYARHEGEGGVVKYGREPAAYEAAPYVTQTMLETFAVVGTPAQCQRQLERYVEAGVTLPVLVPLGCDVRLAIEVGQAFVSG